MPTFNSLSREYATLWDSMEIVRLQSSIERSAARILENRARYEAIEQLTRVPWFVVGIIHSLESGLRFDRHLHNGDPLTRKTRLVPRGRPVGMGDGPFTFEQSATDALRMKGYDQIEDWPVERIAWALERYNGWGYRRYHPSTLSPYLWSGTNHYSAGKYVADGKWSSSAVSQQSGGMALLKQIYTTCTDIKLTSLYEADAQEPDEHSPASNSKTDTEPQKPMMVGLGTLITGGTISAGIAQTKEGVSVIKDIKSIAPPVSSYVYPSLIVALGLVAAVVIWRRTA